MRSIGKLVKSLMVGTLALSGLAMLVFAIPFTGLKAKDIATGSMRPTMSPGTLVIIRSVSWKQVKVGDVVNYQSLSNAKETITHRVTAENKKGSIPYFITKGDANAVSDREIVGGQINGKVVAHVPFIGNLLLWAKKPLIILPIIYIAALMLIIEQIQNLTEYLRAMQPYKLREREFQKQQKQNGSARKYAVGMGLTALSVLIAVGVAQPALAALRTNTVALTHNRISVAASNTGGGSCSEHTSNNTNISITNNNNQTASSGNATVSGNTTGGSATSGNATNNNSTEININVNNCH